MASIPTARLIMRTSLGQDRVHWTFGAKGHGTVMPWLQLKPLKKLVTRTQPPRCAYPWGEGRLAIGQLGILGTWKF